MKKLNEGLDLQEAIHALNHGMKLDEDLGGWYGVSKGGRVIATFNSRSEAQAYANKVGGYVVEKTTTYSGGDDEYDTTYEGLEEEKSVEECDAPKAEEKSIEECDAAPVKEEAAKEEICPECGKPVSECECKHEEAEHIDEAAGSITDSIVDCLINGKVIEIEGRNDRLWEKIFVDGDKVVCQDEDGKSTKHFADKAELKKFVIDCFPDGDEHAIEYKIVANESIKEAKESTYMKLAKEYAGEIAKMDAAKLADVIADYNFAKRGPEDEAEKLIAAALDARKAELEAK